MARKRYTVEQIIAKLREAEVERPAGPNLFLFLLPHYDIEQELTDNVPF